MGLVEIEKLSLENFQVQRDNKQLIEKQAETLEKTVKESTAEIQQQAINSGN